MVQNERFRLRFERDHFPRIKRVLAEMRSDFVDSLTSGGIAAAQSRISNSALFEEKIQGVILRLHIAAGTAKAKQVYEQLTGEPILKAFSPEQDWVSKIKEYFKVHLFSKVVKPIYENTKDYFNNKIQDMIEQGQSIEWLVQQVEDPTFEAYRARLIARTESNRAINHGAHMAAQDTGFETSKEWVAVHDDRTRHSHILLDGKQVGLNESFKPDLAYPGDPNADASETINCRCHLEYKAVRDAQGYLKPSEAVTPASARQRQELGRIRDMLQSNRFGEISPFSSGPVKV